jgi:hypothetical protein
MRRRLLPVGAVAVVVAALLAGLLLVVDGDERTARIDVAADPTPTTSTAPPAAATCASFGGLDATEGEGVPGTRAIPFVVNVQVQASDCVDEVAFLFHGGTPDWSVGYADGPFTDPASRPVEVEGQAFLRVTLRSASATQGLDPDIVGLDGSASLRPAAPSGVSSVVQLGDVEDVTTWVIGLPAERAFEVLRRDDPAFDGNDSAQVVVRIAAEAGRVPRCAIRHTPFEVVYPPGWFAELAGVNDTDAHFNACRFFDPQPFITERNDHIRGRVSVWLRDLPAVACDEPSGEIGSSKLACVDTTVAGLPARRFDFVTTEEAMAPAGLVHREYVVDIGERRVVFGVADAPPGPEAAGNAATLDDFVTRVRLR